MTGLKKEIAEGVERMEALLDKLPEGVGRGVKEKIKELRELLLEQRPPRLALVGRRGSGKSSLINALFGAPISAVGHEKSQTGAGQWWSYAGALGAVDVLDTRGLQEGSKPTEEDSARSPVASVLSALKVKSPDAILFLVKAKEVDAAIDQDVELLHEISRSLFRERRFRVPIIGVITHADELEPKNVKLHAPDGEDPREVEEKLARVRAVEALLHKKLSSSELGEQLVTVHAVSSYQSWSGAGALRADERWRIEELVRFLAHELPREARVEMARVSQVRSVQRDIADQLTKVVAGICATVAAVPIPVADIGPITGLQVTLIVGVGYVSGRSLDKKTAAEFLTGMGANIGAGFALRETARALVKFVFPGAGSAVSAAVAYAGTYAVGRAATAYFIDQVTFEQARARFEKARVEAKLPEERDQES